MVVVVVTCVPLQKDAPSRQDVLELPHWKQRWILILPLFVVVHVWAGPFAFQSLEFLVLDSD